MGVDEEWDDFADVLGQPTEAQMWKQHSALVEAELCIVQTELSKARRDIKKLIDLQQTAINELAASKSAYAALLKEKMGLYVEYVQLQNKVNHSSGTAHTPWHEDIFKTPGPAKN
ncbi:hypothetical protein ACGFZ7_17525 [Pseudomonas sp. NPDC047963]